MQRTDEADAMEDEEMGRLVNPPATQSIEAGGEINMEKQSLSFGDLEDAAARNAWAKCGLVRGAVALVMVPIVLSLIGISYAPFVYFKIDELETARSKLSIFIICLSLFVFHVLVTLTLLSYWRIVTTCPGTVPSNWERAVARRAATGPVPFLKYRRGYKPLRARYENFTGQIILNLDHFCPWVANSVGFYNRKFFILFCWYASLAGGWAAVGLFPYAFGGKPSLMSSTGKSITTFACILDTSFAVILALFAIGHFFMAAKNQVSMEDSHVSKRYDLGRRKNLASVFGVDHRLWLLPVWGSGPVGDGVHWELKDGSIVGGWNDSILSRDLDSDEEDNEA